MWYRKAPLDSSTLPLRSAEALAAWWATPERPPTTPRYCRCASVTSATAGPPAFKSTAVLAGGYPEAMSVYSPAGTPENQ